MRRAIEWETVPFRLNGAPFPLEVNMAELKVLLGLPDFDLRLTGGYVNPMLPLVPEAENIPDVDHM